MELEAEVTQLKEENNKLKRQQLAWQLVSLVEFLLCSSLAERNVEIKNKWLVV